MVDPPAGFDYVSEAMNVLRNVEATLQGTLQGMHISNVCDVRDVCICSW